MTSDRLRLQDILDAIEVVAKYLPADRAAFDRDPPLQSHIYRHLMIIGEATWSLSQDIKGGGKTGRLQLFRRFPVTPKHIKGRVPFS